MPASIDEPPQLLNVLMGPMSLAGSRPALAHEEKQLGLIAEGCTNRQIAGKMFLAEKAVKNYVFNMLRKLGMRGRTEAARVR